MLTSMTPLRSAYQRARQDPWMLTTIIARFTGYLRNSLSLAYACCLLWSKPCFPEVTVCSMQARTLSRPGNAGALRGASAMSRRRGRPIYAGELGDDQKIKWPWQDSASTKNHSQLLTVRPGRDSIVQF